jgi:hypothetical protein
MHFLRQVAQAIPDAPFDAASKTRSLRGIIAIDEAHNFLTQGKKTQPLRELVRIGRSKGVPVILSSQSLEDFRGDTEWNELIPNTLVFCHGVPPSPSTLQGAFRVEPKVAKKLASDCISLDQFVVFTHRHRGADNVPRELRVTPFFERVAAR